MACSDQGGRLPVRSGATHAFIMQDRPRTGDRDVTRRPDPLNRKTAAAMRPEES